MRGWHNQGWRHSLAAKGVPTAMHRTSFVGKPLITNDEINYINRNGDKHISRMTDSEIADHVASLRSKRTMGQKTKDAIKNVDWFEPLKTPSEKGAVGSIVEDEGNKLHDYAKAQMEIKGVEVFDRDFINGRYIQPIIDDFKNGTIRSVDDAKQQIDSKIQYNAPVSEKNPVLSFAGKDVKQDQKEDEVMTWGNIQTEQQGPGAFNFIDKAKQEQEVDGQNG